MQDDLNRLVKPAPPENRLADPKTPPAIRTKTGLERVGAGGPVNSHEVTVKSTDGVFTFTVKVVNA